MAVADGNRERKSDPGAFLTVVIADAIYRALPASVICCIGRQPQSWAKRVTHMGLKRGDRVLFPPGATEEVVIIRVEPCASIEFQRPGTEGLVHPDFRFERPAVRPEIDQPGGIIPTERRHDREA